MDLYEYRKKTGVTFSFLAEKAGCNYYHFLEVAKGKRMPSDRLAQAIEKLTGGVVPADSWRPPIEREE
jgi:transcriptional regulator with XRE-family HTH domain